MPSPIRLTPGRVLAWGLVAVALLTAAFAGAAVVRRAAGAVAAAPAPAPPRLAQGLASVPGAAGAAAPTGPMPMRERTGWPCGTHRSTPWKPKPARARRKLR